MIYFALIGLTLIIVRGTIFAPVRRLWPALLECSQCVGTWVGLLFGASGTISIVETSPLNALIVGGATSFLAMFADAVLLKLLGDPKETQP